MERTILAQAGTTLFHVAAEYLGSANQWYRIALINNIADPLLTGPRTLLLPAVLASQTTESLPS